MRVPRLLLPHRVELLPAPVSTSMGEQWAGDGAIIPARVRPGGARRKTLAGEVYVEAARLEVDREVLVGARLRWQGRVLQVQQVTTREGPSGTFAWLLSCGEVAA